ncbi:MAG: serine/threonine protein kinase [Candidatus Obscuribacterales bacterium]|nr:serine/threonine protein kinase [Candidatus Obscuribacterales bacterium]
MPRERLTPGTVIGGDYQVVEVIDEDGVSRTYQAIHRTQPKHYKIKVLFADICSHNRWLRFQNEARSIVKLEHPAIVKLVSFGIYEHKLPYVVMDYYEGTTLSSKLERDGHLTVEDAIDAVMQAGQALAFAHEHASMAHRDIKPANMIWSNQKSWLGDRFSIKMTDFGLCQLFGNTDHEAIEMHAEILGSVNYMSPEQLLGDPVNEKTDIYSLGCTFYELLCGHKAFAGDGVVATAQAHLDDNRRPLHAEELTFAIEREGHEREFLKKSLEVLIASMTSYFSKNRPDSMAAICKAIRTLQKKHIHARR